MAKTVPSKLRRSFNLLKPYIAPLTGWDKLYDWILNRARVILIIVEIVVFVSFFGKVAVDVTAKNLNDELRFEQNRFSQLSSASLPNIRDLQFRENAYGTVWNNSSEYTPILTEVYSYIKNPGQNIQVYLSNNIVQVSGTGNLTSLVELEENFKSSNSFSNAYIDQLVTDSDSDDEGQYVLVGIISNEVKRTQL